MRCRNCDEEGHSSRECEKPKDWSRVQCRNCNEYGHGLKRCPHPVQENAEGGWGNGGETAAPAGSWADAPQESAGSWADAPQESAGAWADDTATATAEDSWGNADAGGGW